MGIGKPEHKGEVTSYVLSSFSDDQKEYLDFFIQDTADAVEFLLQNSMQDTSAKFAKKAAPSKEK